MTLEASRIIARLETMPATLSALVANLSVDEYRFKPPSGAWSIVEIISHLVDEDREDFRAWLRSSIESPGREWPKTDPEGWARERDYASRDLDAMVANFARERAESLRWLRSLSGVNWASRYMHPRVGLVTNGELLVSWVAHDALHIRQIAKRLFELAARDGADEGFNTTYAGEWGA